MTAYSIGGTTIIIYCFLYSSVSLTLPAYLFHMTALSIAAVWMYNLVLATLRLTNPKEPPPSTWLRSFLSVLMASALAALALLPSIISAMEGTSERGGRPGLCACVVTGCALIIYLQHHMQCLLH